VRVDSNLKVKRKSLVCVIMLVVLFNSWCIAMEPSNKLNKIEYFVATYLDHYLFNKVAGFHRDWYRELGDKTVQFLCLEAGRGGAKTTVAAVGYGLYEICEAMDPSGFYELQVASRSAGATGTATKIMAKIKRELENNRCLIADYGLTRGKYWGNEHIQIVRADGMTVDFYCVGKHSSIRGSRGTVLIDDPQNKADCRSETVLTADEEWLLTDVLPVIIKNQRLIFIGTPISPISLLSKVKAMEDFKVVSSPMEDENGSSRWPEQYSNEFLEKRRRMLGNDLYAAEYLCAPKVSGNPVFREEWFPTYDPKAVQFERMMREGFYIVGGWDGAESKRTQADNSALVVLAATFDKEPAVYCLTCKADKWSTHDGASNIVREYERFKWTRLIMESRVKPPSKDAMLEEVEDLERIQNINVGAIPVRPEKDKVTRAMLVQSWCQQGRVHINKNDPAQAALLDELIMFTGTQIFHDDRVDAFVYALNDIIRNFDGRKEEESSEPAFMDDADKYMNEVQGGGYA